MDFTDYDLLNFEADIGLQNKIDKACELLLKATKDKEKISLSFSGGKDSLACLLLCVSLDIYPEIVWFNSGYEYPETEVFIKYIVDKYGLKLREIKPTIDPMKTKIEAGFFNLTEINKINSKILKPWWSSNKDYDLVLTGIRASESRVRRMTIAKNGQYFFNKSFGAYACYPVAQFSNKQIFAYIASVGEKVHPIYYKAKTLEEREVIRVNWYIFSIGETGYYVFLKREYRELFNKLALEVPQVMNYV